MKSFLKTLLIVVIVAGLALAIYTIFGGDVGAFLQNCWAFIWMCIKAVAGLFETIFHTLGWGPAPAPTP